MPSSSTDLQVLLAEDLLARHPDEAADRLAGMSARVAAGVVADIDPRVCAAAFRTISPATALDILEATEPRAGGNLLMNLLPARAGAIWGGLGDTQRGKILERVSSADARDLRVLATYPPESAGRLRDPRIAVCRATASVTDALARVQATPGGRAVHDLFVVDSNGGLVGTVPLHEVVQSSAASSLETLVRQPLVAVSPFASRAEVVETMQRHKLASLPVVGPHNVPLGVLRLSELIEEVGKELSADLVSMTGASAEESALSGSGFAVRKRLPWLLVNLATAFLAATVVGLFEDTIAQFTALAVLLPVVAGQSGNTGSQALAVVLRGLAVREITRRQLPRVALKELIAGALNGVGVAVVACAGVYVWSKSIGLVVVIGTAMVLAMAIAGVAGAVIPILLDALGQDPAQSSSIILTTVTDVFGFLSFLGLATAFSSMI